MKASKFQHMLYKTNTPSIMPLHHASKIIHDCPKMTRATTTVTNRRRNDLEIEIATTKSDEGPDHDSAGPSDFTAAGY